MSLSTTESAILTRVVLPEDATLSPALAQAVLSMGFTPEDLARVNELSQKAQDGSLTADEQAELDSYERVSHFLALLKSKARRSLRSTSSK